MERFELDDVQAQAIVDMRLGQLSGLERDKIESEYAELEQKIAELEDILAHDSRVVEIIKTDLLEIKRKYGDARRTEIGVGEVGIEDEDLIPVEDCVFTLTNAGYVLSLIHILSVLKTIRLIYMHSPTFRKYL